MAEKNSDNMNLNYGGDRVVDPAWSEDLKDF